MYHKGPLESFLSLGALYFPCIQNQNKSMSNPSPATNLHNSKKPKKLFKKNSYNCEVFFPHFN